MKILSVDDSFVIRSIIKSTVSMLGHEFAEAESAEEGLSLIGDIYEDLGLILLDWNLPGMTGYDLLRKLKADDKYKHIPVMMVTTESEKYNIIAAVRAGAANYITKPFSHEDILTKIMECVGGGL